VEWPTKRCYVGLVAVGVQEQAEDILVPPLLRNCLTLNDISFPSHYLPSRTVVASNSFYCLGHFKNVYDDDDDDDDDDDGDDISCPHGAQQQTRRTTQSHDALIGHARQRRDYTSC